MVMKVNRNVDGFMLLLDEAACMFEVFDVDDKYDLYVNMREEMLGSSFQLSDSKIILTSLAISSFLA